MNRSHETSRTTMHWYYMDQSEWKRMNDYFNTELTKRWSDGIHRGRIGTIRFDFDSETVTNDRGKEYLITHVIIKKPVMEWFYFD